MKIETQYLEDNQAKLTVEVEPELMDGMKHRAARKIARSIKIPGFRPGKAPYPVIVRQVGEPAILEQAMELLVDEIYPKVIEQSEIKPYGPGSLENVVSTDPPVLEFKVPLEAQVTLGDYRSLRKPYEPKELTKKDVDEVLENLRERQAVIEPVERPAQLGDLVTVKISGSRVPVEEGQDTVLVREREVPILVTAAKPPKKKGKKKSQPESDAEYPEWPFPGFSQELVGLSAGDEKTLHHVYPEDAKPEVFKGVDATFQVKVVDVKLRTLPELDDDFAVATGEFDTMEALLSNIRTSLEQQNQQAYNDRYDDEVLTDAINQASFKYPPQMIEHELDDVIRDLETRLERQNMTMDLYLKTRKMEMPALREELKPMAEGRLKQSLFYFDLAKAEDLHVETEELQNETKATVDVLSRSLPEKEARKLNDRNVYTNLVGNIMMDMLYRRAKERMRDIASGKLEEKAAEPALPETVAEAAAVTEAAPVAEPIAGGEAQTPASEKPAPKRRAPKRPATPVEASIEAPVEPAAEAVEVKPKKRKKAATPSTSETE